MNILVVTESFFPDVDGGSGRFAFEVATRLARRRHSVTILGERVNPGLKTREQLSGVNVVRYGSPVLGMFLPWSFTSPFFVSSYARALSRDRRFDVVWGHHYSPGLGGTVFGERRRVPALYTYHASRYLEWTSRAGRPRRFNSRLSKALLRWWADRLYSGLLLFIERKCLEKSRIITVLSRFSKEQLESIHRGEVCKARIVPAGVDTERFRPVPDRAAARRELGLPEDGLIVLTVRRLIARMGLEHLIDAMKTVADREPRAYLLIGGKGYLYELLAERIARTGVAGRVKLLGYIEDSLLPKYYAASDLFVLPTLSLEGFGMVTLESLACGTPVLGSRVGATPEILGRLDRSLILERTDPDYLAQAVLGSLARGEDAEFRARCRAFATENYSWEVVTGVIERIMEEAANLE